MKKEELIKEVVYISLETATKPNSEFQLFEEACAVELDIEQRKYIGNTFAELVDILNKQYLTVSYKQKQHIRIGMLFHPYVYCVQKGLEVAYNLRKGKNKTINFDGKNVGSTIFGLDLEDEVIAQAFHQINDIAPLMDRIFIHLYAFDFMTSRTRPYVFEAMLWGAIHVGVEWCLRMDLE